MWHSELSPARTGTFLTVLSQMQLPANSPRKAEDTQSTGVPTACVEARAEFPTLNVAVIWGMDQQMQDLSLPFKENKKSPTIPLRQKENPLAFKYIEK